MREVTVRIRFTRPCLGNVQDRRHNDGRLVFARTGDGQVMFLPSWHKQNLRLAAQLLGRHQEEVDKIHFDVAVDGALRRDCWYKRYYVGHDRKRRYAWHECFFPGQVVGINCIVPSTISDDDLLQLFNIAGRYRGLSPWKPGEYGHFVVEKITPRRGLAPERDA